MGKPVSIFVCGVQKGGTTSSHAHLCEHPALSPPSRKEIHFFDDEARDWHTPDYTALDSFFLTDDGDRPRFDVTPIYCFWAPSLNRIQAYNPDSKLIFLFRDPFERPSSQWCMEYALGNKTLPFSEAIRQGKGRMSGLPQLARERRVYTYIERGLYAEQVRWAMACFPREQVLFLRSVDLLKDHARTLNCIATFLGIEAFPATGPKREHVRLDISFPSAPNEADLTLVADLVRDDLRKFSVLTGLDVSKWPTMQEPLMAKAAKSRTDRKSRSKPTKLGVRSRPDNSPRAIMVLGMHRSGTSAITRVIGLLGADLPNSLLPPSSSNEAGHWESNELMLIHDQVLASWRFQMG